MSSESALHPIAALTANVTVFAAYSADTKSALHGQWKLTVNKHTFCFLGGRWMGVGGGKLACVQLGPTLLTASIAPHTKHSTVQSTVPMDRTRRAGPLLNIQKLECLAPPPPPPTRHPEARICVTNYAMQLRNANCG